MTVRMLCLACRAVTEVDENDPVAGCPACGNNKSPADADDTVTITLTVHELRVLTIWASNYAEAIKDMPDCEDSPAVVYGILDEITKFTDAPLSLRQEFADLRSEVGDVTVYNPDGTVSDI